MDFYLQAERELNRKVQAVKDEVQGKIRALRENCAEFLQLEKEIKELGLLLVKCSISPDHSRSPEEIKGKIAVLSQRKNEILEENNILPENEIFYCPICKDSGFVEAGGKKKRCSCFLNIYTKLLTEGQTDWNTGCFFDDFSLEMYPDISNKERYGIEKSPKVHMTWLFDLCKDFTGKVPDSSVRNMVFTGKTGLGKTFLCSCMANELIRRGVSVLYIKAPEMFNEITFNGNRELRNQLYTVQALFIDDLGTERQTDMRYSDLLEILEKRQMLHDKKGYATVISTNLNPKELLSYYDERICSRLFGNYDLIRFVGEDIRLLKK